MNIEDVNKICSIIDDVLREYQEDVTDLLYEAICERLKDKLDINIKIEDYA